MKMLTIRQPWVYAILHCGKDIENRGWSTPYRGPLLLHAAKGMTRAEYDRVAGYIEEDGFPVPPHQTLDRGGIVGVCDLVDVVTSSNSPWFGGEYGFVLANVRPLPFHPCVGNLGLRNPPTGYRLPSMALS